MINKFWENDEQLFVAARKELFTAVVGDAMDKMNLLHQFLPPQIQPLKNSMFLIGRAMTVLEADTFEDLIQFLQIEIGKVESKNMMDSVAPEKLLNSNLNWTGSKTNLIELVYALQSSGSINSGTADIKEIALMLERVFNIDLGNYYQTFTEIRSRKSNPTKFIDNLKESLINRLCITSAKSELIITLI